MHCTVRRNDQVSVWLQYVYFCVCVCVCVCVCMCVCIKLHVVKIHSTVYVHSIIALRCTHCTSFFAQT